MTLLRRVLSPLLVATLLLTTEGIAISIHLCCGSVETISVYQQADDCCCQETATTSDCDLDQHSDCCQISDAYLLMPVGATRNQEAPMVVPLVAGILPVPILHAGDRTLLPTIDERKQPTEHPSPPLLQTFRL